MQLSNHRQWRGPAVQIVPPIPNRSELDEQRRNPGMQIIPQQQSSASACFSIREQIPDAGDAVAQQSEQTWWP